MTEKLNQLRDKASPSGLMAGSQTSAVITVDVLVEKDVVLPLLDDIAAFEGIDRRCRDLDVPSCEHKGSIAARLSQHTTMKGVQTC